MSNEIRLPDANLAFSDHVYWRDELPPISGEIEAFLLSACLVAADTYGNASFVPLARSSAPTDKFVFPAQTFPSCPTRGIAKEGYRGIFDGGDSLTRFPRECAGEQVESFLIGKNRTTSNGLCSGELEFIDRSSVHAQCSSVTQNILYTAEDRRACADNGDKPIILGFAKSNATPDRECRESTPAAAFTSDVGPRSSIDLDWSHFYPSNDDIECYNHYCDGYYSTPDAFEGNDRELNMGNLSSQQGDKKGKGLAIQSNDGIKIEAKGSPGRFRIGRGAKKTQTPTKEKGPVVVVPAEDQKSTNDVLHDNKRALLSDAFQERSPSIDSGSVSSSVYVDTVSHLPTPDDVTLHEGTGESLLDTTILEDSMTLDDASPGSLTDITVFVDEKEHVAPVHTPTHFMKSPAQSCPTTPDLQCSSPLMYNSSPREKFFASQDARLYGVYNRSYGSDDFLTSSPKENSMSTTPTFTLTHHRKVVLPPHKFMSPSNATMYPAVTRREHTSAEDCLGLRQTCGIEPRSISRRHSLYGDVPPLDGNVLRKVASLTLDKATIELKVNRPKFVPEKLDFRLYEKFEGQMLLNWFISAFPEEHYIHNKVSNKDLKILAAQFCTHLLAAGVILQIEDETIPPANIFRPDLMYYWTHLEMPTSNVQAPGKLSFNSWPPLFSEDERGVPSHKYSETDFRTFIMGLRKEHRDSLEKLQKNQEIAMFQLRGERESEFSEYRSKVEILEREVDKYQTLAGIQELTRRAQDLDASPLSPVSDPRVKLAVNVETQTRVKVVTSQWMQTDVLEVRKYSIGVQTGIFESFVFSVGVQTDRESLLTFAHELLDGESVKLLADSKSEVSKSTASSEPVETASSPVLPSSGIPPPPPPPLPSLGIPPPPPLPGSGIPPPPPLPSSGIPPPPPLPGSGIPPPPPLPGSGIPPPPPLPGLGIPPPPPLPGLGIPPPPPPPGLGIPPPPPPPGLGIPPPPPPFPGMGIPPPPLSGAPPLPPPPPQGLGQLGPNPLPPPPPGGWYGAYAAARKEPVTPKAPMKPLYWTRIQVGQLQPVSTVHDNEKEKSKNLWENLEESSLDTLDDFVNHFSRQVIEKKVVPQKKETKGKKLLDQRRSQKVGILISSLRLDISEIENAVYNFDTSVIEPETLQKVYEVRPDAEELKLMDAHLESNPNEPLDKPEKFLYDLSKISEYADRVTCITFQANFAEAIGTVENKLNNLKLTCEVLLTGKDIQKIFGIILALGNYMNGGNRTRGQADGFGLEILGKLKDVKSQHDKSMTLLYYIVQLYIKNYVKELSLGKAMFPLPEPSDVEKSSTLNFDDISEDLKKLYTQIKGCESKVQKVITASDEKHKQPFKDKMEEFLAKAFHEHKEQTENLEECKSKFVQVKDFYSWNAKSKNESEWPKEFFSLWAPFCNDFKDMWKKELQRIIKKELDEAKRKVQEKQQTIKQSVTSTKDTRKPSGLKAKLAKRIIVRDNSQEGQ